ncbi:MAG TPA: MmcQ/YjbR family DNA-binding protein [Flavobacteriales bacterium]
MDLEGFRRYCLAKPGVTEETPFGPDTVVYKVMGKVFALAGLDHFTAVNLKCDPERAVELRERYQAVRPGYHMNKKHWNTVAVNEDVDDRLLRTFIDDSYGLVAASLPKKLRDTLPG